MISEINLCEMFLRHNEFNDVLLKNPELYGSSEINSACHSKKCNMHLYLLLRKGDSCLLNFL